MKTQYELFFELNTLAEQSDNYLVVQALYRWMNEIALMYDRNIELEEYLNSINRHIHELTSKTDA